MAHDARDQSLSECERTPEERVAALEAILGHLLRCISETQGRLESDSARIDRCAALARSAEALAERARVDARDAARAELLRVAAAAGGGDDGLRHEVPRGKRDRHGLRLVTVFTLLAGALAGLRAAALAGTARKAAAAAITLTAAGGIAVAPALQGTGAAEGALAHHARDYDGHRQRARHRDRFPAAAPQRTAAVRRRQRAHATATAAPPPSPDPSPTAEVPTAAPSPMATPSPSVSVTPLPSPSVSLRALAAHLLPPLPQWQH